MKKILAMIMLALTIPFFSCDDNKKDDNNLNAALLMLLGGGETLTVNVTYGGVGGLYDKDPTKSGSGKLYVLLYPSDPGLSIDGPEGTTAKYVAASTEAVNAELTYPVTKAITVRNVKVGTYYLMVLYDYRSGNDAAEITNQSDRYELYNDAACPAGASTIDIVDEPAPIDITFDDTNLLVAGGGTGTGPTWIATCYP